MRLRLAVLLGLVAVGLAVPPAHATPVKCSETDITLDGRVFPEPRVSTNFLRFDELECGVRLLERRAPHLLEVTTVGTSRGGHPVYDVLLTDERVDAPKEKLLVVSSIHGDEVGGREGAARVLEDMVDPALLGREDWVEEVLDRYVIHFLFPNPDGWVEGDVIGSREAGVLATRGNAAGRDLNRDYPVRGYASDLKLQQPESRAVVEELLDSDGWFLGTDNHGQLADTYAAAGLQIVGQFDFQKSETLARFADGITEAMKEFGVLGDLERLKETTGQDLGAYHWGTLYDMLGYSASGSMIDFYNTPGGAGGTGFATELTVGREQNWLVFPAQLDQVWVDSIRAINFTMFRQAVDRREHRFPVGSRTGYVFDPDRVEHDDANGAGPGAADEQAPYSVSRMDFFEDLSADADRPLRKLRVADVLAGGLADLDSLVLAGEAMPEAGDRAAYVAQLRRFVEDGGNLVVTDGAVRVLPELGVLQPADIAVAKRYVGAVEKFVDRAQPLNAGLRGVASQTYDTVPIGFRFGSAQAHSAPNWTVARAAWEAAGGTTAGTTGEGRTSWGELPLGRGTVRFLGALLPDPTEDFSHPYGLQSYAVTYTGYTLLENALRYERPAPPA